MALGLYDIQSAIHSIAAVQSGTWDIGTVTTLTGITNDVNIADGGNSITVDAVNLDIRDLTSVSDSVSAVQSGTWNIGTVASITADVNIADGGNSITVDAVDLDIRDLASGTDSVSAVQSGTWNIGTVASITADVNIADGGNSITIDDGGASITVDGTVSTVSGGYASWKVSQQDISSVAESEVAATPLTGRLRLILQNLSNNEIYVKEATGVTTANGMLVAKRGFFEAELDDGANLFAIADSGTTNDLRVIEYAA